jgi:hypothetical protein
MEAPVFLHPSQLLAAPQHPFTRNPRSPQHPSTRNPRSPHQAPPNGASRSTRGARLAPLRTWARPAHADARIVVAVALLGASAAFAALTGSAHAALISTGACDEAPLSEPFASYGDTNLYELVPQGDFSVAPSQWTLGGGAYRSESAAAGGQGTPGAHSLTLPAGATAQSPYVCVNASYPTFRLFARNAAGGLATLSAAVVYRTVLGPVALPLGLVAPGVSWQPTPPLLTASLVAAALSGGTAQAALRFTALTGSAQIDDVYIDPRMR